MSKMSTVTINGNTYEIVDKKARADIDALPSWSKQSEKPIYSANEVGAEESGTAENVVGEHNTSNESHTDIRLLIKGLTDRLNTLANSTDTDLDQIAELVEYIKSNRTLIESITTNKVNVIDIINNLTTNVADKPLSAAQGVELLKLINLCNKAISNIKVPTKTSELENDKKYITYNGEEGVPGLSGYIHNLNIDIEAARFQADYAVDNMPRRTSQLQNDSGYITEDHAHDWRDINNKPFNETQYHIIWDGNTENCETIGSGASTLYKVSDKVIRGNEFVNSGLTVTYETGFTVDIPSSIGVVESNGMWNAGLYGIACVFDSELSGYPTGIYFTPYNFSESGKPIRLGPFTEGYVLNPESLPIHSHTPAEVGAEKSGMAEEKITEHNASNESHNDIRLLIEGLTTRLNTIANSTDTDLDQLSELVEYIKSNRSLIDGITTGKVSVVDIVNNLTTNVANKPLSAAQGVALKVLIDAIVVPTMLSQLTDDVTHRLVTDTEKQTWNNKSNFSGIFGDLSNKPTTLAGYGITDGITSDEVVAKINEAISGIAGGLKFEVVDEIPVWGEGNTIYLVRSEDTDDNQYYNEYIFIKSRGTWEKLGDTRVNLEPYYTGMKVDNLIYNVQKSIPTKMSQLYNDADYVKASDLETGEATWESIKGNILYGIEEFIEWDGNTEGLDTSGSGASISYRVSDRVIRADEFSKSGMTVYYDSGGSLGIASALSYTEENGKWYSVAYGVGCVFDGELAGSPEGIYFSAYNFSELGTPRKLGPFINEKLKKELLPDIMEITGVDTLTWDGNTNDRYNILGMAYHISDAIPTLEDLQRGGVLMTIYGQKELSFPFTSSNVIDAETAGVGSGCYIIVSDDESVPRVIVVYKENATAKVSYNDQTITATAEKTGVYLSYASATNFVYSLTINGYNEFNKREVIKNEHLSILETVDKGNTLTWDGVSNDKFAIDLYPILGDETPEGTMIAVKVSDATPTLEELNAGATIVMNLTEALPNNALIAGGTISEFVLFEETIYMNGDVSNDGTSSDQPFILVAMEDDYDGGVPIVEKGIYFIKVKSSVFIEDSNDKVFLYPVSVTFNGYNFEKEIVKNKYLDILETINEKALTIMWDGDTTGKTVLDGSLMDPDLPAGQMVVAKVSDNVPLLWQLNLGGTVSDVTILNDNVSSSEEHFIGFVEYSEGTGIYMTNFGEGGVAPAVVVIMNEVNMGNGVILEKGIYLLKADGTAYNEGITYVKSVTFNGVPGVSKKDVIKDEYLNILNESGTDTLYWDGDTIGRVNAETYFHVSDYVLPIEDLNVKNTYIYASGTIRFNKAGEEVYNFPLENMLCFNTEDSSGIGEGTYAICLYYLPLIIVATKENATFINPMTGEMMVFEKPGIYFGFETSGLLDEQMQGCYVSSLTINGYNGFRRNVLKKEYMPKVNGIVRSITFGKAQTAWEWLQENYDNKKFVKIVVSQYPSSSNHKKDYYWEFEKITKETGDGSDGYEMYNGSTTNKVTGLSTEYFALHSSKVVSPTNSAGTTVNILRGGIYHYSFLVRDGSISIDTNGVTWSHDPTAPINRTNVNGPQAEDSGFEIILYYIEE